MLWLVASLSVAAQVKDARKLPREYAGPGREAPEPGNIREVAIGYFGPSDPNNPDSDLYRAAALAVEQANREGGYKGIPFRLVAGWAENPWAAGAPIVARMVFNSGVWAIIGGIDGPSTHLAEQVVAKALVPLISPVSSDKTVNYASIPWMFSCMPSDEQIAPVLGDEIVRAAAKSSFVLLSANDHDSHLAADELMKYVARHGMNPLYNLEFKPGETQLASLIDQAASSRAGVFLIEAPPADSARVFKALSEKRPDARYFGGVWFGRPVFTEHAAGANANGQFPALCDPHAPHTLPGSSSQEAASCASLQTYDAARLVIAAIRRAGLNRARIRDEIEKLSPWKGEAGIIEWDNVGQNRRAVRLMDLNRERPANAETQRSQRE